MLDIRKGLGDASVSANSSVFFIILAYLKLLAEELGSEGVFASFGSAVHHSSSSCFVKQYLFQKHECANIELFFHTLKIFSKKMFHFINNV